MSDEAVHSRGDYTTAFRILDAIADLYSAGSAEWREVISAQRLVVVEARREHGDQFADGLLSE